MKKLQLINYFSCMNLFKKTFNKMSPSKVNVMKTRKATGFKSLQLKYIEINQATPKRQIDFWTKPAKTSKVEKVNINIKLYIFKLEGG